jgi:hypothetical protein
LPPFIPSFVQDGVSRTAGVRTDHTGVAPRFGFSWNAKTATLVSGGYGIAYFRPTDTFVYKAQPFINSFGVCSSLTCPGGFTTLEAGLPKVAEQAASDPSGVLLGMRAFHYHNSYIQQFNLGIEQQHGNNTMRIFYVGALGRHIARSFHDINAPLPNTAVNPDLLRPYYSISPNLTSVVYIDTEASSSYNALQTSFSRSYRSGLTVQFNYTWAHGLDNAIRGDAGSGTIPALSSTMDYGNSSFDVRHRMAQRFSTSCLLGRADPASKDC